MKKEASNGKKVFIGLSGGVDSSVSAYLLKKQGFDVTGVFIQVWQPDFLTCTWPEDRRDAMRVCAELDIPFLTLDLEKVYKQEVVDYMIEEYKVGKTPNPDVVCNRSVKFGAFLKWAKKQGADAVSTGHYAQVQRCKSRDYELRCSVDENKDQTYFLWKLTQEDLEWVYFPVGHLKKQEVRSIATKANLLTASKKDSQGLCFLGKLDMKEFLKHFIDEKPGKVLLQDGTEVGVHEGSLFYTLGERHGFDVTHKDYNMPMYVTQKDFGKNILIVSPTIEDIKKENAPLLLCQTNWITTCPSLGESYLARIRHRGDLLPVTIKEIGEESVILSFKERAPLVSSGQSVVLYREYESDVNQCIGGGVAE